MAASIIAHAEGTGCTPQPCAHSSRTRRHHTRQPHSKRQGGSARPPSPAARVEKNRQAPSQAPRPSCPTHACCIRSSHLSVSACPLRVELILAPFSHISTCHAQRLSRQARRGAGSGLPPKGFIPVTASSPAVQICAFQATSMLDTAWREFANPLANF